MEEDEIYIIKAKGLPIAAEAVEVATFFAGCDIRGGKNKGIKFLKESSGKSRGIAYVEFHEEEDFQKALSCNKNYLGDRSIEVTQVTQNEMDKTLGKVIPNKDEGGSCIIRVTGMPHVAMHDEVSTFFAGCDIKGGKKNGITFIMNDKGGPKGMCFVEFLSQEDVAQALMKNGAYMGNRFCKVTRSSKETMHKAINQMNKSRLTIDDPVLKLKGLPFQVTKVDIRQFFQGVQIKEIELTRNEKGNFKGDAFVEFEDYQEAIKAMGFTRQKIQRRHIDIFKSSKSEWESTASENPPPKQEVDEPVVRSYERRRRYKKQNPISKRNDSKNLLDSVILSNFDRAPRSVKENGACKVHNHEKNPSYPTNQIGYGDLETQREYLINIVDLAHKCIHICAESLKERSRRQNRDSKGQITIPLDNLREREAGITVTPNASHMKEYSLF